MCEYIDGLILSDRDIKILEVNDELEDKIESLNLKFPTKEEFEK